MRTEEITHDAGDRATYHLRGIRENASELQELLPSVL